jgi:hypothetical protein
MNIYIYIYIYKIYIYIYIYIYNLYIYIYIYIHITGTSSGKKDWIDLSRSLDTVGNSKAIVNEPDPNAPVSFFVINLITALNRHVD